MFCFDLINEIKNIYKFVLLGLATPTRQNCNLVTCDGHFTSDEVTVAYKLQCSHLTVNKSVNKTHFAIANDYYYRSLAKKEYVI